MLPKLRPQSFPVQLDLYNAIVELEDSVMMAEDKKKYSEKVSAFIIVRRIGRVLGKI